MKPQLLSAVVGGIAIVVMGVVSVSATTGKESVAQPLPAAPSTSITPPVSGLTLDEPVTTTTSPMSYRPQVTATPPPPPTN